MALKPVGAVPLEGKLLFTSSKGLEIRSLLINTEAPNSLKLDYSPYISDSLMVRFEGPTYSFGEIIKSAMAALDLSKFEAWKNVQGRLPDTQVYCVDYEPENFDLRDGDKFAGSADILLTYQSDFMGPVRESLSLPAAIEGTIADGVAKVTDIRIAL
jgi:hypothetical protein